MIDLKIFILVIAVLLSGAGWIIRRMQNQVDQLRAEFDAYRLSAKDEFADKTEYRAMAARAFVRIDKVYELLLRSGKGKND